MSCTSSLLPAEGEGIAATQPAMRGDGAAISTLAFNQPPNPPILGEQVLKLGDTPKPSAEGRSPSGTPHILSFSRNLSL
jgi:hypothetical protein